MLFFGVCVYPVSVKRGSWPIIAAAQRQDCDLTIEVSFHTLGVFFQAGDSSVLTKSKDKLSIVYLQWHQEDVRPLGGRFSIRRPVDHLLCRKCSA